MSQPKYVLAVRHAPTVSAGLCVGNAEVACTLSEQDAAERILSRVDGCRFIRVWTSPIERCRAPAALIARRLRLPLGVDERLQEISLGEWQLRTWDAIAASEPERYQAWLENWLSEAPPGGELPSTLVRRVGEWWSGLPSGQHLLISHAGVNRALRVLVHGQSWTQAMSTAVPHLEAEGFTDQP